MATKTQTSNLEDLKPIELFPYAVRFTRRYMPDKPYYYRRYTALSAARAAANHYVADKPTIIYKFNFEFERWEEYND